MSARAVLLDVEGTTIPLSFVKETLFPMARQRASAFLTEHQADREIESALTALTADSAADAGEGAPDGVLAYYLWLMDRDRKSTSLKTIQGRIWQEVFETGQLRSPVFSDVPRALRRWKREGRTIAIYSSGSELAQRLVFRYSEAGDLSGFISRYFDTAFGAKKESASYARIAEQLDIAPQLILFLSDHPEELKAAGAAGLAAGLCIRPGNPAAENTESWLEVRSFDEI
jgi:enolase-phosphatase E1